MLKLTFCLRRQAHLTREEFQDYWYNHHGRLGQRLRQHIGMVRYVQTHTQALDLNRLFVEDRGAPEPYDGVAEAWWPSLEFLQERMKDPAAQAAMKEAVEDEARFIDFARSPIWLGEERVIIDKGEPIPY
jgi:hypothetical protein